MHNTTWEHNGQSIKIEDMTSEQIMNCIAYCKLQPPTEALEQYTKDFYEEIELRTITLPHRQMQPVYWINRNTCVPVVQHMYYVSTLKAVDIFVHIGFLDLQTFVVSDTIYQTRDEALKHLGG